MRALAARTSFRRDIKRMRKRAKDLRKLQRLVDDLRAGERLALKHQAHMLSGEWHGFAECHIEPDWLLVYQLSEAELLRVRIAICFSNSEAPGRYPP